MSRCVILSAGPFDDPATLSGFLMPDDYIIAADGGWNLALALSITPSIWVGDFDSQSLPSTLNGVKVISLPVEKDVTDTEKALEIGFEAGYRDFLLLGCTGGRLDHQQAAVTIAAEYARRGCSVVLADEKNEIHFLTAGTYIFPSRADEHVSLFAFGEDVCSLFADGLYYDVADLTLSPFNPICVSNTCVDEDFGIAFKSGLLMLYFSRD